MPPLKESLANYKWSIRGGRMRDYVFHKVAQLFCWVAARFHTTSQKRPFYAPHSTLRSPKSAPSWLLGLVLPDHHFFSLRTLNVCKCHKGIWDVGGITPLILHLGPEISDNGGPQTRYGRVLEVMICRAGRVSKCDSLNNVLSLFHQINSSQYLCNTRREIQIQTKLDQPPWKNGQHQTSETRPQLQT